MSMDKVGSFKIRKKEIEQAILEQGGEEGRAVLTVFGPPPSGIDMCIYKSAFRAYHIDWNSESKSLRLVKKAKTTA